jgi:hypothetical protein
MMYGDTQADERFRAALMSRSTSCPVRYFRPTREETVVGDVFVSIVKPSFCGVTREESLF